MLCGAPEGLNETNNCPMPTCENVDSRNCSRCLVVLGWSTRRRVDNHGERIVDSAIGKAVNCEASR